MNRTVTSTKLPNSKTQTVRYIATFLACSVFAICAPGCGAVTSDDDPGAEDCATSEDCSEGYVCEVGACEPVEATPLAETVVSAWYVAGTATTENGPIDVEFGWWLCSDQRMYGFTKLANFTFLDKGSYTVQPAAETITVTYRSKDTTIGDTYGPETTVMSYSESDDSLAYTDCCWGAALNRIEGAIDDSDCDPGW